MLLKMKKRKGESVVTSAYLISITFICIFVLLLIQLNHFSTLQAYEDINAVMRTYLIKMELNGYLVQNDVNILVDTLEAHGVTDIKISGNFNASASEIETNYHRAEYGEVVQLTVKGILNVDTKMYDLFGTSVDISEPRVDINITKRGVAVR